MLLWDDESEGWDEILSTLSPARRRKIALDGISAAIDSFKPSFEDVFSRRTVDFVRNAMVRFRAGATESDDVVVGTDQFFDELHSLIDKDDALGVASLVMAISIYADSLGIDIDPDTTLEILSASYEAVLNSERIGKITPETERQNENCVGLIERQRGLITP